MADIQQLLQKASDLLNISKEVPLILNEEKYLLLLKQEFPSELDATFYEPALCLILQGRKEIIAGQLHFTFGVGQVLIVSHEMPVVSKIAEASESEPYIALVLRLDMNIIRELQFEIAENPFDANRARSLEVNDASDQMTDALFRLVNASQDRAESIVLLPQILREIHFRLLQVPCGGMLRNLLRQNSHASKISKAISLIRCKYSDPLSFADVAKSVGMSASSFYHHFKVITESTPLQYQKKIRLLEARRLLMSEGESVTITALKVGYESPNQFSREYLRTFGSTPSSDLKVRALSIPLDAAHGS